MKYGVPVAISTDDEGVARSDMTHEYLRAVEGYHLSYADLKRMTRQSLEHSFLPGQSLWASTKIRSVRFQPARRMLRKNLRTLAPAFLNANERAREQWKLEREFAKFEKRY